MDPSADAIEEGITLLGDVKAAEGSQGLLSNQIKLRWQTIRLRSCQRRFIHFL